MAAPVIPVTMLSGFLGAGKTTLLRHLLEQSSLKIGCVVNDVADVNIDAKLVRNDRARARGDGDAAVNSTADLTDTVELANGCACCSIQDELFGSFEQLLALADARGGSYDRIVLENSGVAEPQNVRDKFAEAVAAGHPLTARLRLDTMVTVVDAASFVKDYASRAPLAARPDLGEGGSLRPVVDLLVEQVECADYVILNKIDQLAEGQLQSLRAIAGSLNPLARVVACERGAVDVDAVFGPAATALVANLSVEGQHRGAVAAAAAQEAEEGGEEGGGGCAACAATGDDARADGQGPSCGHGHGHHHHYHHHHGEGKHEHEHAHGEHKHAHGEHKHGDHAHAPADPPAAHTHAHDGHAHDDCAACAPVAAPKRARQETTAAARFGIKSFVYSRRRPFHPQRLRELVLRWLPVATNAALEEGDGGPAAGESPIKAVLRSKGFMWLASSHATAFYWSHAGTHFEIRDEGDWWAAVPDADWPADAAQRGVVLSEFDGPHGDRRQEIVFIGAGMDRAAISAQLDAALLSDDEFGRYEANWAATPDPDHSGAVGEGGAAAGGEGAATAPS